MKKWIFIAAVVLILFGGAYCLVSFCAVQFVQSHIQKAMGPGWTLSQTHLQLTHLGISGIQFKDPGTGLVFLEIEEIRIYPDLLFLFKRTVRIREVAFFKPTFFFYRSREGDFIGPWVNVRGERIFLEEGSKDNKQEKETIPIEIDRLKIEGGSVTFEDRRIGEIPVQIRLKEMELKAESIEIPLASIQSLVELKGSVIGKERTGSIRMKGWFDLKSSDLEISLNIQEVDLSVFKPYYWRRVSAEVKSGMIAMESQIAVKQGVIRAFGKLQVSNLEMSDDGTLFFLPAKRVQAHLKDRGNRIEIPFQVKGDLKDPTFTLQDVFLMQIGFGLAKALGSSIPSIGGGGRTR